MTRYSGYLNGNWYQSGMVNISSALGVPGSDYARWDSSGTAKRCDWKFDMSSVPPGTAIDNLQVDFWVSSTVPTRDVTFEMRKGGANGTIIDTWTFQPATQAWEMPPYRMTSQGSWTYADLADFNFRTGPGLNTQFRIHGAELIINEAAEVSRARRWDGAAWTDAAAQRWDGAAWIPAGVQRREGTGWQ